MLLNLEEQRFFNSQEVLLNLARKFEEKFYFAKNLKKFDYFSLENDNSEEL